MKTPLGEMDELSREEIPEGASKEEKLAVMFKLMAKEFAKTDSEFVVAIAKGKDGIYSVFFGDNVGMPEYIEAVKTVTEQIYNAVTKPETP